jgi:hypothetical protein
MKAASRHATKVVLGWHGLRVDTLSFREIGGGSAEEWNEQGEEFPRGADIRNPHEPRG